MTDEIASDAGVRLPDDPAFVAANDALTAARTRELTLAAERAGFQEELARLETQNGGRRGRKTEAFHAAKRRIDARLKRNADGYLLGEPDRADHPRQVAAADAADAAAKAASLEAADFVRCARACVYARAHDARVRLYVHARAHARMRTFTHTFTRTCGRTFTRARAREHVHARARVRARTYASTCARARG